jgi:hypothetical protein
MLPDTFDVLKAARLLNEERRARAIAHELVARAVGDIGDIDEQALIADEMRVSLVADDYDAEVAEDLNGIMTEDTRPAGPVYRALEDFPTENGGYSLCSASVQRRVQTADGGSVVVRKTARFASCEPSIVAAFRLRPVLERAARAAELAQGRIADDLRRNPALAAHVPPMIADARNSIDRALPRPQGQ